jgi:hypothetical protein
MFFAILHIMDNQLLNNFSFGRSAPHWHPFISSAYFGVIVQIHVLRVMRGIIPIPPMIMMFLDTFENIFPLDSIIIPGPLVPLLESITAFEGNFSNIGNVCANFPTFILNPATNLVLPNNLQVIWPNVLFILDQIRHEAETAIPANFGDHRYFTRIFGIAPTAAQATVSGLQLTAPLGRFVPFVPQTRLENFRLWVNRTQFPTRAQITGYTNLNTDLSIEQSIGFCDHLNNYIPWFAECAPVMAIYARHFEGSAALSRISTRGLGAASLIAAPTPGSQMSPLPPTFVAAAGNVVAHFTPDPIVSSQCNIRHNDPNTEELAEQYGTISMVNVDLGHHRANARAPGNGLLRQGPYWAYPSLRILNNVNVYPGLPLTIRDFYVKERIQ